MRDKHQWIPRLICVLLILAMGAAYQTRALAWQKLRQENQAQVADVETHNAQVLAEEARRNRLTEQADSAVEPLEQPQTYQDGCFTGTGTGFGGDIVVSVQLLEDEIIDITIDTAEGEDTVYLSEAKAIVEDILAAQSAEVDTISGATFSSTGIREAVQDALEQAREAE